MFVVEVNMVTNSASWVLDTGCGAHICNYLQMLQTRRKLSKDEVVLRLGDGKAVAAEAVGIINLVISDRACGKRIYQRPRVDFEETFLPVAMAKSIQIMLAIAAWYDYEIWQMDVKTAFLNSFIEEEIVWINRRDSW
ncbi:UNVERIFIED_CONTAM: hypothetical protein Scaly_0084100 [Sesamum calycinum]|uniref:Reverse transcriptase Ty1/copia-type domain-containing protein n=1 Tax=Sesamum calycinum TaxID=2727403 RepID=A0AAW2SVT4_9LAMI